jgi:hypothetical protein
MSVKVSRANSLYGYPSPQSNQFLDPIVTNRAPLTSDRGIPGQAWVDQTNNLAYMFNKNSAGLAQWIQIVAGGGAGVFTSLIVTGALTQSNGPVDISVDPAVATVNIATGLADKTLNLGSTTNNSSTSISAGNNGITLNASSVTVTVAGSFRIVPPVLTPADTVVIATANAYSGSVRFNQAATWIALPGALLPNPFVITNSALTATAAVLVTIQTEGSTPLNNMLRVAQVLTDTVANTMTIYVVNDVAATGPSDCTRCIVNFIVMTP